jgi:hypothetical protein
MMHKFFKATRRKHNFQHRLQIESLETRNLLSVTSGCLVQTGSGTLTLSGINSGTISQNSVFQGSVLEANAGNTTVTQGTLAQIDISGSTLATSSSGTLTIGGGGILTPFPLTLHHAPSGTNGFVNVSPDAPYTLSVADFGFTDPGDTPPDNFTHVSINTLPASGSLLLDGAPVIAKQVISTLDIAAGKLQFVPPTGSAASMHPRITFQVIDDGIMSIGPIIEVGEPNTLVFSLGPNVAPVVQDDVYSVNEGGVLNEVFSTTQWHTVTRMSTDTGSGTSSYYDGAEWIFTASKTGQNGITISLLRPDAGGGFVIDLAAQNISFAAPHGDRLAVGTYENARSSSLESDTPYIKVGSGLIQSSYQYGQFTVNQVEYNDAGEIVVFDATYSVTGPTANLLYNPLIAVAAGSPTLIANPYQILTGHIQYHVPMQDTVSLSQNDTDANGDPLTTSLVAGPQHGVLHFNNDGTFNYTPNPGFNGVDTFQYKSNDGIVDSNVATVTVNVLSTGHAPVGTSQTIGVPSGSSYVLKVADFGFTDPNDTPADTFTGVKIATLSIGDRLMLSGVPGVEGQFISVEDINAGNLVVTPTTGTPHFSFTFQVEDNTSTDNGGENLDPVAKTLTFDTPPAAQNDTYSVFENHALDENDIVNSSPRSVLENDSDADGEPITAILVRGPDHGSYAWNSDGRFSYTPSPYFTGVDTFQYKANDGFMDGNIVTVTINVLPISTAPAGTSGSVSIPSVAPYTFKAVDFGFTDPYDSHADSFTRVMFTTLPTSGSLELDGEPLSAGDYVSVDDIAASKLTFTCEPGIAHATCTFQVEDSGSTDNGGVTIDPTPKILTFNRIPVAQDDSYTTNENTSLDPLHPFCELSLNNIARDAGTFRVTRNIHNGITIDYDPSGVEYYPNHPVGGLWRLSFAAANDALLTPGVYSGAQLYPTQTGAPGFLSSHDWPPPQSFMASFTITNVVYSPSGEVLEFDATFEQGSTTGGMIESGKVHYKVYSPDSTSILANDNDADGETLTSILVTQPQNGSVSLDAQGHFVYTPNQGFVGTDTFQYKANDGIADSSVATVSINVIHVSHAPEGISRVVNIPADTSYTVKVEDFGFSDPNDSPADSFVSILIPSLSSQGVLKLGDELVVAGQIVSVADIAAGKLTFTPNAERVGNGRARFYFQVEDSGSTDHGGVNLDIQPKCLALDVNPVAKDDVFTIGNTPTVLNLLSNDHDADGDYLHVFIVSNPAHGVLKYSYDGGDKYTYTPDAGYYGTDTFQYTNYDGMTRSNVATVTINVGHSVAVKILPAPNQPRLTTDSPIHFIVNFSEPVVDFTADDFTIFGGPMEVFGGSIRGSLTATITPIGTDGRIYDIAVTGMRTSDVITVSLQAGVVHTADGISNVAASSKNDPVEYLAKGTTISGTSGNDVFVFQAGDSPATWKLTVNGQSQVIPADISSLLIDGLSGSDTLSFTGSTEVISALLGYDQGKISTGKYTVAYANMESVAITGASGNDVATLHDSSGNDAFEGLPNSAQLTTVGKSVVVKNFKSVSVESTAGNDTAVMYGSQAGDSSFEGGPAGVKFVGAGFNYVASGFKAVSAYASPGKNNSATFNSTDGHDLLIASYLGAQYIGKGFAYDVWNLSSINGLGSSGDEARFYGSPSGDTVLNASPSQAIQTENNLTLVATGYSTFASYVYPGGNTTANIVGSIGDDRAVTSTLGAQLFGSNFELSAWTYKKINLIGNEGHDVVHMYGSSGANSFEGQGTSATLTSGGVIRSVDRFSQINAHGNAASQATFFAQAGMTNTFDASPTQASMSSEGNPSLADQTHGLGDMQDSKYGAAYKITALDFGSNTAYGIVGGTDVANYTGSAGTDYFISSYLGTQMFGQGYSNAGWNFATMNATSTGGADTARFYGSPSNPDKFVATPTNAKHSGTGYQSEAKNFARVEAYSGIGSGGTAQLTGTTGDDHYVGSPLGAQLWNQNYRVEAWNYASIKAEGNGGNDTADMYGKASNNRLAADNVFAEFSGDGFANHIDHFATTAIHGSTNGTDTAALDHAFLEKGTKVQPGDAQGHTIARKLWLYDFDEATITKKPDDSTPHPQAIDKLLTAFMFD